MARKQTNLSPQEQELFKESGQIVAMVQSEGWAQVLRPFLETKLNQSFPDPTEFQDDDGFLYAAKTASIFKKVVAEILNWVEGHEIRLAALQKKLDGDSEEEFSIGKD